MLEELLTACSGIQDYATQRLYFPLTFPDSSGVTGAVVTEILSLYKQLVILLQPGDTNINRVKDQQLDDSGVFGLQPDLFPSSSSSFSSSLEPAFTSVSSSASFSTSTPVSMSPYHDVFHEASTTAQQQEQSNKNNNILKDLFSNSQSKAGQIVHSNDDFDPRGGAGDSNIKFNAFGDNMITKPGDDGLANLSSAFSAPAASTQQRNQDNFDLFKSAPASLLLATCHP